MSEWSQSADHPIEQDRWSSLVNAGDWREEDRPDARGDHRRVHDSVNAFMSDEREDDSEVDGHADEITNRHSPHALVKPRVRAVEDRDGSDSDNSSIPRSVVPCAA